jgi:hypothetical protein
MARWTVTRSELGNEHLMAKARGEVPDPLVIATLRRRLKVERAEEYLQKALAAEPLLSSADCRRLASLMTRAAIRAATREQAEAAEVLDATGLQDAGWGGGLGGPDAA